MYSFQGMEGYEAHIDHLMHLSEYLVEEINMRPNKFHLLIPQPEMVNVMFWYIPKRLRGCKKDAKWEEELAKVSRPI